MNGWLVFTLHILITNYFKSLTQNTFKCLFIQKLIFFVCVWWLQVFYFLIPKIRIKILLLRPNFVGILSLLSVLCLSPCLLCSLFPSTLSLRPPCITLIAAENATHLFFSPLAVSGHRRGDNADLCWHQISNGDAAAPSSFLQLFSTSDLITLSEGISHTDAIWRPRCPLGQMSWITVQTVVD